MDAKKNYIQTMLDGAPIWSWVPAEELYGDGELMKQARAVAALEPVVGHVALMPDCHPGYGMPIGGVAAFDRAISPFCVGMDIGCGMHAVRLDVDADEVRRAIDGGLLPHVTDYVPVGKGGHRDRAVPLKGAGKSVLVSQKVRDVVPFQTGTLGSNNHYAAYDVDEHGNVWINLHSGSRILGKELAEHYHRLALAQCRDAGIELPYPDLAYLTEGTPEFDDYVEALAFALDWAMENRRTMGLGMLRALEDKVGHRISVEDTLNVHHNEAVKETHGGRDVWVHRKGATRARAGERVLIPGNITAGSYICEGLGSADSFESSSHGAGRTMGRNEAKRSLDAEKEFADLKASGVVFWSPGGVRGSLDEMASAYKSVETVMARQDDLVRVECHLHSLGVIKG